MTQQHEKLVLSEEDFIAGFHAIGEDRYHHRHPFHKLMHEGALSRGQMQAWALNRYYYQSHIPRKDAMVPSATPKPRTNCSSRSGSMDSDTPLTFNSTRAVFPASAVSR